MNEIERAIEEFADSQAAALTARIAAAGLSPTLSEDKRTISVGTEGVAREYGLNERSPRPWVMEVMRG